MMRWKKPAKIEQSLARRWAVLGSAMLMLLAVGCGGDGAGGLTGPSVLSFIFDISNIWFVENDTTHEFNLVPTSPASDMSGTFNGDETLPSGENSLLTGSFTGPDIQFTVQRDAGSVTFSGTIVNQNRMEVAGGGTNLVIVR